MKREEWFAILLVAAVGALGLLPGAGGAFDAFALLAWLTLSSPALGILIGMRAGRRWPIALFAPAIWAFLLLQAQLVGGRSLESPAWGILVIAGFFLAGIGVGGLVRRRTTSTTLGFLAAGCGLALMLLLAGAPVQAGLGGADTAWARNFPELARVCLELSPLVVAFESVGVDWTHSQPDMYVRSGVEWSPRVPYRGFLAAPVVLLVGSLFAILASRRGT